MAYAEAPYKLREHVERCVNRFQQFRRRATRDDKLCRCFRAVLHLTAGWLIVKVFVNTA